MSSSHPQPTGDGNILDVLRERLSLKILGLDNDPSSLNSTPEQRRAGLLEQLAALLQEATTIAKTHTQLGFVARLCLPVVVQGNDHRRLWTILVSTTKDSHYRRMGESVLNDSYATVSLVR